MSRPSSPVVLAAVLGPMVVFGLLGAALQAASAVDTHEDEEADDAGLASWRAVESGQLSPEELMAEMDVRMASHPDVVLVGNSYAGTSDPGLLARHLGLPEREVVVLSIPYSVGAHWRGVIEYGVIAKGYRPRLVLVQGTLANGLMPASTPKPGPLTDLWVARSKLQRTLLTTIRDVPVRWAFPRQPDGKPTVPHRAVNRVFDPGRMDATLHGQPLPIAEGVPTDGSTLVNPEGHVDVAESDIPRIAELCAEHGLKLAWVAPPDVPGVGALGDQVTPERRRDLQEEVERRGGLFLDLRRAPMSEPSFHSRMMHESVEGMRRSVPLTAEALLRLGALGDDRGGEVLRRVVPTAAPADGLVAPGATARWELPAWTADPARFEVRLLASTTGALPEVRVGGEVVPPSVVEIGGARVLDVETSRAPAAAPWTIEVAAGDAAVQVHAVTVGRGAGRTVLLGSRLEALGQSVDLLAGGRAVEGTWEAWEPPVTFAANPPELPLGVFTPEGRTGVFAVPELAHLSDTFTLSVTPRHRRCSPVRVLENGAPLPRHNTGKQEVRESGAGRVVHAGAEMLFAASDSSPPYAIGSQYELALDPGRRCDGGVWLYPGDTATLPIPDDVRATFHRPIRELTLTAAPARNAAGPLELEVRSGGEVVLSRELTVAELRGGPIALSFDPPLDPAAPLELTASNEGRGFLLWTRAALAELPGASDPLWSATF